ncbi:unnamed protein product [Xylocopa violacea]|uniref:Uncharacterized protein n=1 Tax=Xylocopa violacea TaxID=135666 RepID=A0ABP1N000_XYLVO
MPTHLQVIPCPRKQIIRNFIREVPCPRGKPKKKQTVQCPGGERKRNSKQLEDTTCFTPKCVKQVTCPPKQPEKPANCCLKSCPGKERKPKGCPKCELERIQKLECEVYRLRKEIERMKYERKESEKAIQKAIIRSARALGGRCKSMISESVEKLLDTCNSDTSSQSASSLTNCAKNMSRPPQTCHNNSTRKKDEFDYCYTCNH